MSENIILTEKDVGKTLTIKQNQMFSVMLPENPSTGFSWQVNVSDDNIIKQIGEGQYKQSSPLLGAGGILTLLFCATDKGNTNLKLNYKRLWEVEVTPETSLEYYITVI